MCMIASLAIAGASCSSDGTLSAGKSAKKSPIEKPQIQIKGGRITPEALWAMGRIGAVKTDIETGLVAYTVSYYSVAENRSTTWIRICESDSEGEEKGLQVIDEFVGSDPAWFGDSGVLAYLRDGKLFLRQDGDDIEVKYSVPSAEVQHEIDGFLFSPMRDRVVLIHQVKTVPSTADRYPDLPLATGHAHEDLMYKHWDEWTERAPQPFVYTVELKRGRSERIKSVKLGTGVNLLANTAYESPMKPFGGVEQLAWNPNNGEIAYTCRKKTGIDYAVSTNSDIYLIKVENQKSKEDSPVLSDERNITESNKGYDTNPAYSPSGEWIAWLSMEHDGYESDENRLMILNTKTGEQRWLSEVLDSNVDEYGWYNDSTLLFTAVIKGTIQLYAVSLTGEISKLTDGQFDLSLGDISDHYAYLLKHSMCEPNDIYRLDIAESLASVAECQPLERLTDENSNIFSQITLSTVEPRWQKTTDGKQMLTWIIYPPHFDPKKKYPTILYCEGGPQSPVSQFWSYRWNFMMMSAGDYIIVAPNRRGLPGFGKEWNEQISGDYGGQCMRDYLSAIDEFCTEPYVDTAHLGCVGASFGGFSVYWLAGHHEGRFKAFIAHDGIFNMEMQYLETEEKWFANWDMGGAYWEKDNAVAQRTFANSPHHFVDKWDTPILCIHGEKDYRILANQAMAAFDAAKMRGVPAKLLIFPDENHWVLHPQNGILWQREFRSWLDRWLKESKN